MTTTDVTFFKPNELIAAIDEIQVNRTAKHLCNYFLKFAQNEVKFNNHQGNLFEINIAELNEEARIQLKDYKLLDKYLTALMRPVTIRDKDDPQNFIKLVPIYRVNVNIKKGIYQFKLDEDIIDLLRKTDYFTKLELHDFNFLISKYSLVLYEWLKRYETAPKIPQLSIDELRKITNTADKKGYDNFKNLKSKIIDVAVTEISEKTPYIASYEIIKAKGRTKPRVSAIQFIFKRKDPTPKIVKPVDDLKNADPVYLKLKRRCGPFFTLEFFYKLTYLYYPDTLHQYAEDLAAKRHTLAEESYFNDWLEERCSRRRKGYNKRLQVYSEEFFRDVFTTSEVDPDSILHTLDGREVWFGKTKKTVHEEYVKKAMDYYGKLPYDDYRHYLSGIWNEYQKEFNVIADNVFEQ